MLEYKPRLRTATPVSTWKASADNKNRGFVSNYPTGGIISTYVDSSTGYMYRVHKFLYPNSDAFVVPSTFTGKLLVVGGGGSGGGGFGPQGWGGGGGGGAVFYDDYIFTVGSYTVIIGQGATHVGEFPNARRGANGGDSSFDSLICYGGGGGGSSSTMGQPDGLAGGSGGGGGNFNGIGGAATLGIGNPSGTTVWGAAGASPPNVYNTQDPSTQAYGAGGTSYSDAIDIDGNSTYYGRGGAFGDSAWNQGIVAQADCGWGGKGGAGGAADDGSNGIVVIRYRVGVS